MEINDLPEEYNAYIDEEDFVVKRRLCSGEGSKLAALLTIFTGLCLFYFIWKLLLVLYLAAIGGHILGIVPVSLTSVAVIFFIFPFYKGLQYLFNTVEMRICRDGISIKTYPFSFMAKNIRLESSAIEKIDCKKSSDGKYNDFFVLLKTGEKISLQFGDNIK